MLDIQYKGKAWFRYYEKYGFGRKDFIIREGRRVVVAGNLGIVTRYNPEDKENRVPDSVEILLDSGHKSTVLAFVIRAQREITSRKDLP